jgi:putative cell wall-binding protein
MGSSGHPTASDDARPLPSFKVLVALALTAALVASLALGIGRATSASATVGGGRAGFAPGSMILWESDADLARDLDSMVAAGGSWVRFDFDWPSIQPNAGSFNWTNTDRLVAAATSRGLKVLALPTYTPAWARPAGTSDKTPPTNPADFATFVRAAAQRYAGRGVHHWEIWNEPNLSVFWSPAPNPVAYTNLLKVAHAAIKGVDPSAAVLFGGLAPAADGVEQISPITFVRSAYGAGAHGYFDAVAVHPYSWPAMPVEPGTETWNAFMRMTGIHDLMTSNGDGDKQIWGTEYGAPTGTNSRSVSEDTQALMASQVLGAMAQRSWTGPLFWYSARDRGTNLTDIEDNFGLIRFDGTPKKALAAFTAAAASASAPAPIVTDGTGTTPTTAVPSTTSTSTAPTSTTSTSTTQPAATKHPRRGSKAIALADVVTRVSGDDRVATAIALSEQLTASDTVVIASAQAYADALVGGPLAAQLGAPVLLTAPGNLDPRVERELHRLEVSKAVVLGGEAAISSTVSARLEELGITVERIGQNDRYATAAAVATRMKRSGTVLVASGDGFADALAAGSLGLPVLLTRHDSLPADTRAAIGSDQPIVIGGLASVGADVLPGAQRVAGEDRYATAAAVADWGLAHQRIDGSEVFLARGDEFADAMVTGSRQQALLLVAPSGLDGAAATGRWLSDHAGLDPLITVVGGVRSVSTAVPSEVFDLLSV